jgi:ribonuclease E
LQLLRAIEEMLLKGATHNIIVRTRSETALYLLNHKRAHLRELEERFQLVITVNADASVAGQVSYVIEKGEQVHSIEQARALVAVQPTTIVPDLDDEDEAIDEAEEREEAAEGQEAGEVGEAAEAGEDDHEAGGGHDAAASEGERNGRKRRRRRRGRRGGEGREGEAPMAERGAGPAAGSDDEQEAPSGTEAEAETEFGGGEIAGESPADGEKRRRRRGRRGGRRSRHGRDGEAMPQSPDATAAFGADEQADMQADIHTDGGMAEPYPAEAREREPEQSRPYQEDRVEPHVEPYQAEVAHSHDHGGPIAAQSVAESAAEPTASPTAAAPRRGSTVREPAPTSFSFGGAANAPAAAPAEPVPAAPPSPEGSTESEDAARPRRAGWWSKRVLGKG